PSATWAERALFSRHELQVPLVLACPHDSISQINQSFLECVEFVLLDYSPEPRWLPHNRVARPVRQSDVDRSSVIQQPRSPQRVEPELLDMLLQLYEPPCLQVVNPEDIEHPVISVECPCRPLLTE